ncbi:phytanoyl-CoA dioxygenase family protein [Lophium mytilinum]|uniref:Phytanoyl-CoA dioxygenase family protein n=1 Tax=Lophium mytilinum TaxID=390894 RepID=A0A6A6QPZ8_9PEZI|nr:phytanoyl-CoA dioxygenase family protein [Lophium mytilinum]
MILSKAFPRTLHGGQFAHLTTSPFHSQKKSLSSLPLSIKPSPSENSTGLLSWRNLQTATRALHRDGLVVIEDVIDPNTIDHLNTKLVSDARTLQSAGDASPYNYNKGNIQQDPPLTPQFFSPSVFLNPLARQVIHSILGPRSRLSFISANSAMPPTPDSPPQSQPVHSDADFAHPASPFALVVNIPLIDMTIENGSTEVWLGTHSVSSVAAQEGAHGERASGRIASKLLEERREERPPSQPTVKKGSIVLRDLRLWHAGKPNLSQDVRVMLALIHFAAWYRLMGDRNPMRVEFDEELREVLESAGGDLQVQGVFMPRAELEERYLKRGFGNSYDFDQQDRLEELFE